MKDIVKFVAIALLAFGPVAVIKVMNYHECRAHGFSRTFCITH
jgi:hypothetical protein